MSMSVAKEGCVPATAATAPVVCKELRKGTHWTPYTLRNNFRLLDVNMCIHLNVILETEAVTPMFCKTFGVPIGNDVTMLTLGQPILTAEGATGVLEKSMGVMEEVVFTLSRSTLFKDIAVETIAYWALLGMDFVAGVGGSIDTWTKTFTRYIP